MRNWLKIFTAIAAEIILILWVTAPAHAMAAQGESVGTLPIQLHRTVPALGDGTTLLISKGRTSVAIDGGPFSTGSEGDGTTYAADTGDTTVGWMSNGLAIKVRCVQRDHESDDDFGDRVQRRVAAMLRKFPKTGELPAGA